MPTPSPQLRTEDFELSDAIVVGAGALSYVVRARHIRTKVPYAIKIVSKVQVLQQQKVDAVMREKDLLFRAGPHPFIARLHGTMQSDDELYFVQEVLPHGDLLEHIRRVHSARRDLGDRACLTLRETRNIAAQVIVGLERLFALGGVLRDLKPENVCFDVRHRAVLIDFDTVDVDPQRLPVSNGGVPVKPASSAATGEAKKRRSVSEIQAMRKTSSAFCGTAQYVSPEMLGQCTWSYASDLWALGAMVHHCVYGAPPFDAPSPFECMKKVILGTKCCADFFRPVSAAAAGSAAEFAAFVDFVSRLLALDPTERLGVDHSTLRFDAAALRCHPFMCDAPWAALDREVACFAYTNPFDGRTVEPQQRRGADERPLDFSALYDDLPVHSDEYAEYAHRTGGDNAFERFATRVRPDDGRMGQAAAGAGEQRDGNSEALHGEHQNDTAAPATATSGSDDDVFDDVGQRLRFQAASLEDLPS